MDNSSLIGPRKLPQHWGSFDLEMVEESFDIEIAKLTNGKEQ